MMPDDIFKMLGVDDKAKVAMQAERYVDILLKYFQILYYAHSIDRDDLAESISKKFVLMIELLVDNMSEDIQKYQKEHGEI